ncbi:MAG TPA: hypothetical protein VK860_13550 [Ilumatobacteraceae bacterium]|nr:hypothetical protein [Ilumatobacteraceae bacterium]
MSVEMFSAVDGVREALETLSREVGLGRIAVGAAEVSDASVDHLHPDEHAAVERAVDRRKAEFATGRQLLRSLLSTDQPIRVGPAGRPTVLSGEPVSIAHDEQIVVAVAVHDTDGRDLAVGVDIEPWASFPVDLGPVVLRPDEIGVEPCLAFCAKEAAYKAWSAAGGRFLEHHDVRVVIRGRRLTARVVADGIDIAGAWTISSGRCVVLAWLC